MSFFFMLELEAQVTTQPFKPKGIKDTSDQVSFDNAQHGIVFQKEGVMVFWGDVEFSHKGTFFYADSVHRSSDFIRAFGNILIQQGDTMNIFGDSLHYNSKTHQATIFSNVTLDKGSKSVFAQEIGYNTKTKIASYDKDGTVTDGRTWVKSRSGTYNTVTEDVFLDQDVYVNDPEFNIKAKKLKYNMKSSIVNFIGPTVINQNTGPKIYCEGGYYNVKQEEGIFTGNVQYEKNKEKVVAEKMVFDGTKKYYEMTGNAKYQDSLRYVSGESIKYWQITDLYEIRGNAFYQDEGQTLNGEHIVYDKKNGNITTKGRSKLEDKDNILEADSNVFDNKTGIGSSDGNVIWTSKSENITMWAEHVNSNRKTEYFKAFGDRALFRQMQGKDSIFISADTLSSYKRDTLAKDSVRFIKAYYDVKIFGNQFQGVCDSMFYSSEDSISTMYGKPILWSDTTNQYSADTIKIFIKNEKLWKLELLKNALILTTPDEVYFNQIGGRNIDAIMNDSTVSLIKVKGNAQSVYYSLNEAKEYTGMNTLKCSNMDAYMVNNSLDRIKFYEKTDGHYYPMKKANHSAEQLKGFKWEIKSRPSSVLDLKKLKTENISIILESKENGTVNSSNEISLPKPKTTNKQVKNKKK